MAIWTIMRFTEDLIEGRFLYRNPRLALTFDCSIVTWGEKDSVLFNQIPSNKTSALQTTTHNFSLGNI